MINKIKDILLSKDIKAFVFLLSKFVSKYSRAIVYLVVLNLATGVLLSLQPLLLAPALSSLLGVSRVAAEPGVNLNNIGFEMLNVVGVDSANLFLVITFVMSSYVLATVVISGLSAYAYAKATWLRSLMLKDMIVDMHRHILSLPLVFFNSKRSGDLTSRAVHDTTATVNALEGVVKALHASVQILIYLLLLLITDLWLSISMVLIGSVHFLITRVLKEWVKKRTTNLYDYVARMSAVFQETFLSIRIIKSFAAEEHDSRKVEESADLVKHNLFKFRMSRYAEEPIRMVADSILVAFMFFMGYFAMESGRLNIAGFVMFLYLARQLMAPLAELSRQMLSLFSATAGAQRIIEIYDTKSTLIDGPREATGFAECIKIEKVNFGYLPDVSVLKDVDLEIRRGDVVAIVGSSGAGKSTLADIILRLYDPDSGSVLYDGINVKEFTKNSYLNRFGVVSQECLLLHASVKDNIVYGRPLDPRKLEESLIVARADEFVGKLPKGFETEVGDRGIRLSGGQRQRIAIARAIYGNPEIMILDEATSALDTESERYVQEALDRISKSMTTIVVAHRLSTIVNATKIVVIESGRIESVGRHEELLEKSPIYRKLYEMQFAA